MDIKVIKIGENKSNFLVTVLLDNKKEATFSFPLNRNLEREIDGVPMFLRKIKDRLEKEVLLEKKAEEAIDCLDKCIGKVYKVNGSIGEIARKERQEEVESPEYKKQRIARWEAQGKGMPPEYQTKKAKKVKK